MAPIPNRSTLEDGFEPRVSAEAVELYTVGMTVRAAADFST
jgi:hypothetical protein